MRATAREGDKTPALIFPQFLVEQRVIPGAELQPARVHLDHMKSRDARAKRATNPARVFERCSRSRGEIDWHQYSAYSQTG